MGSSPALILQTVDVLIALCLAGITRLAMEDQVRAVCCLLEPLYLLLVLSQLQRQVRESGGYGKGVADILVKADPSLPAFVAIV